jgi:hypothetical protein
MGSIIILTIYQIPFYLIIGIPVTYIIDFGTKKFFLSTSTFVKYFIKLIGYTLSAFALSVWFFEFEADKLASFLIPVYTYFHILLLLKADRHSGVEKEQISKGQYVVDKN